MKSSQFANTIKSFQLQSSTIYFAIGPSSGFSNNIKEKANSLISLSQMTFPHELAALILIEQIYRGTEIIRNTPYHVE
jgi:23S rRNA (pseudouridine1915-N3)-methyltransferase